MSFINNYPALLNELLMTKRTPDDIIVPLALKEDKFKKASEKFNWALRELQQRFANEGKSVMLFHIILSLHNHFSFDDLMTDIIDKKNKDTIIAEMTAENYIKEKPKKSKGVRRGKKAGK